jgi:hypothetical protein
VNEISNSGKSEVLKEVIFTVAVVWDTRNAVSFRVLGVTSQKTAISLQLDGAVSVIT